MLFLWSKIRAPENEAYALFQCYLDDSGTSGMPIITMAGFVAHVDEWRAVEPALDLVMNEYRVPIFHATDYHSTKGVFGGWSRIKKQTFANELFAASKNKLLAVSATVGKRAFEEEKRKSKLFPNMSAYGLCFSLIMTRLLMEPRVGSAIKQQGISFLVETGNHNNAGIDEFFGRMAEKAQFEGCLRSLSFVQKTSCRAIQLADFWAFYSRKHMRDNA